MKVERQRKLFQRKEKKRLHFRALMAILIVSLVSMSFAFAWYRFVLENNQTGHLLGLGNLFMSIGIYTLLTSLIFQRLGAFQIGVNRGSEVFASQILALLLVNCIEIPLSMAVTGQIRFWDNFFFLYLLLSILQLLLLLVFTRFATRFYAAHFPPMQVLEIYGTYDNSLAEKINDRPYIYRVSGKIAADSDWRELTQVMADYDAILINDVSSERKNDLIKYCYAVDQRVYFTPKLSDILTKSSLVLKLFDTPIFYKRNGERFFLARLLKRSFDLLLSLMAVLLLSPLFLVVSIAIKLDDGGPIFYRQARVTKNGRIFDILKFRSMIVDAEKDGKSHPAESDDERITKVGRWIRPSRIDELPQLINIIKGDMSIVGPRPERVEHVQKYTDLIPEFSFRSKVRGGLTGYAQVYGKYNTSPLDKLKLDLIYIQKWSPLLDFQLIIETIKVLFKKESTEGFSPASVQAIRDYSLSNTPPSTPGGNGDAAEEDRSDGSGNVAMK